MARVSVGIALLVLATAASAQSYRDVTPTPPPATARPSEAPAPSGPTDNSAEVAVASLRGLEFTTDRHAAASMPSSAPSESQAANGAITAKNLPLLDTSFLAGFAADLGKPITFGRLA
jgi:hypothetical protein